MSCAAAACPTLLDLQPLRSLARAALGAASCALQMAAFAAVLWLCAAGPGFIADHASTVAAASHTPH